MDSWGWNTPGLWQDRPGCRQDRADWDSWGCNTLGIWQDMPAHWQDRLARWQDRPGWWQWPTTDFAFWSPKIATAMKAWVAFPSWSLLQDDGLEVFARRSKNVAARAESLPDVLLSHLPPDPRELAIGRSATISIKNLTQRHRGEVRELSSSAYWSLWGGKVPVRAYHPQLIGLIMQWQPASGGSEPASDSRQRQPAPGGSEPAWGCNMQLYMRVAKVFSLMDLFAGLGAAFTADALYKFYLRCPLIARRRKRRRNAKIRRLNSTTATTYFSSGRWPATPSISFLQ